MSKSLLALGRLKTGVMNKTEAAYAAHLEQRKHAGEVTWALQVTGDLPVAETAMMTENHH